MRRYLKYNDNIRFSMNEDEISCLNDKMRDRIREAIDDLRSRSGKKLTLTDIAEEIGISYRYLNDILNKKTNITFDKIVRLTDYFNVSFEWLIGREDHKKPEYQYAEKNYGLEDSVLSKLNDLTQGKLPYDPKYPTYNPVQCGFNESGERYVDTHYRYFLNATDKESREKINCRCLLSTINWALGDHEFMQLIDSYAHSVWASERLPEGTSLEDLDILVMARIHNRLNDLRRGWMANVLRQSEHIRTTAYYGSVTNVKKD